MSHVSLTIEEGIAHIQVQRPEALNALNREIVDEIDAYIENLSRNEEVRVLVIYSKDNFAAGADIKKMALCNEEQAKAFVFTETYDKIEALPFPTIAAIEGYALGGGLELALTCDIRFSTETAKLGFPEITLGIMPGAGGTIRTPKLIGPARAKELIFSGNIIDGNRAKEMGLVNDVFPGEELFESTMKFAKKLASRAPIAMKLAKKTLEDGLLLTERDSGTKMEAERWATLFNTQDQKEGMQAFIEKRKPVYQGK